MKYNIESDIFLDCYQHLLDTNEFDIEYLYGGRDSGKSRFIAQKLAMVQAMNDPRFRCILIKKTAESIKDSQWQTIKDVVEFYNIDKHFTFRKSPLEIELDNGAKFIARGCDDPRNLKSISNPSCAWIEEADQISREDFTTIITTLRSDYGNIKIYASFNPELPKGVTDKKDWWLWSDWFSHTTDTSFENIKYLESDDTKVQIKYRATWTTYKDNPYVTPLRKAFLENLQHTDPTKYVTYTLGMWGIASNENPTFYGYHDNKHFVTTPYILNPNYFLDISFDFNIDPCTATIGQFDRELFEWHIFDTVMANALTLPGQGALQAVCREIKGKYIDTGKIIKNRIRITGDPSGKGGSADRQEGMTFYYTIAKELQLHESQFFVRKAHATHVYSVDVCNYVLTNLPQGKYVFHNTYELIGDINKTFFHDRSLDAAKKKYGGLHHMDNWRYLNDFWFSYHGGRFITDSKTVQNYIDGIARRQAA